MPGKRPRTPKDKREETKRVESKTLYRIGQTEKADEKLKESQGLRRLRREGGG